MSRSDNCPTAQNFPDFAQNLEICIQRLKNYAFNHFYSFFLCVSHILCDFCIIFFSWRKIFKLKILTTLKNLHLKCLGVHTATMLATQLAKGSQTEKKNLLIFGHCPKCVCEGGVGSNPKANCSKHFFQSKTFEALFASIWTSCTKNLVFFNTLFKQPKIPPRKHGWGGQGNFDNVSISTDFFPVWLP